MTVNFDHLAAGTTVEDQYQAEGVRFGYAERFGQSKPEKNAEGNCGPPEVEAEGAGVTAASAPNYALLASCGPGGFAQPRGLYGALTGPAGSLSVEVSDTGVGAVAKVVLVGYDISGHEVASAQGEALSGSWSRIALVLSSEAKVS